MLFFGKNKKKKDDVAIIEKRPICPSDIYIRNVNEYVTYYGKKFNIDAPLDDTEFYQRYAVPYYNAAMKITNFVNNKYPDNMFVDEEVIDFDYSGMLEQLNDEDKALFFKPKFPELIYINDSKYFTHFHVCDDKIHEAEGIEVLPGLSRSLADRKINKLFEGLSVVEAKDLLLQMSILPKESELENVIKTNMELVYLNKKFLESVIALFLVIHKGPIGIAKARFLADSLGINFDFSPFEQIKNVEKKLAI